MKVSILKAGRLAVFATAVACVPTPTLAQSVGVEKSPVPAELESAVEALPADDGKAILKRWGVRLEPLRLAASGYMLDFRYHVVDARKARPLFERKARPVLKDERTGTVLAVPTPPKTGPLRSSNDPKAGRSYFMFFGNPGRLVAEGQTVTISIGEFRVAGIRVSPP